MIEENKRRSMLYLTNQSSKFISFTNKFTKRNDEP